MTLRTRITLSVAIILAVVVTAIGVVATNSIEQILVAEVDDVLVGFSTRGPAGPPPLQGPAGEDGVVRRDTAEIVIDPDGQVVAAKPSGFVDDPDPLPQVDGIDIGKEPVTVVSVDGSLEYRAIALDIPSGQTLIRAFPLDMVTAATSSFIRTLLVAGGLVLLVGAAVAWWSVSRSTRPVEQMVQTAEEIAAGDLSQRVDDFPPDTEFGKLATSLNQMMSTIEQAVEKEKAGQETMRQFVADASHELRTPITAVAGYAELHQHGGLEDKEAANNAWRRIGSESSRMASLVEDLLMLAQVGEAQPLLIEENDLATIVAAAVADHHTIDSTRPVKVTCPESVPIRVDGERIHQVISNLLGNVRVHTPEGTTATIEVVPSSEAVTVSISDDGPGIPEESLSKVFDRFYRADKSRSRKSGGSGLGLSIVKAIVEAHGGTIDARNRDGTHFEMVLPNGDARGLVA